MATVAIIGAGPLGGALAHTLAQRDLARQVRLIDPLGTVATGKALDIQQAAAVEGFATQVSGSADLPDARGALVVVLADSAVAGSGEWQGEAGLTLLRQLTAAGEGRAIVCAGAQQRSLVARGVRELGVPRDRIVGSAPSALASGVRALVALHLNASPSEVAVSLAGVPPGRLVICWSSATVAGRPLDQVLTAAQIAAIEARVVRLWPPGPYALASAAAGVVEALITGARRAWTVFLTLPRSHGEGDDLEVGGRGGTIAVPVRFDLGRAGRIQLPALSTHERVQLETARHSILE